MGNLNAMAIARELPRTDCVYAFGLSGIKKQMRNFMRVLLCHLLFGMRFLRLFVPPLISKRRLQSRNNLNGAMPSLPLIKKTVIFRGD